MEQDMFSVFESLESRRMFAVSAMLTDSIIHIQGDGAANQISVVRSGANLLVRTQYDWGFGPVMATLLSVPESSVTRIVARGGGGNDSIAVSTSINKRAWLYGDDGRDVLSGGSGYDYLYGGEDNDTLRGNGGGDALFGENGHDLLVGGDYPDVLFGGSGNDVLDMRGDTYGRDFGDGGEGFDLALVDWHWVLPGPQNPDGGFQPNDDFRNIEILE
jgi:Ca2+-binding RTX toxin-like protein